MSSAPKPPRYHRVWIKVRKAKPTRWRRGWKKNQPAPSWRDAIASGMDWAVKNAAQIHYAQIRPVQVDAIKLRDLPITTDCSGSDVMLCRDAGIADPTGNEYDPHGVMFTGTIRSTLPRIRLADALCGDDIVYGHGNGDHVVKIRKPHRRNPVVFSHGQEAGPFWISHARELRAHGDYFTVHRNHPVAPGDAA